MARRGAWSVLCVALSWCMAGCGGPLTVMSYNVGGLFDTVSEGTEYASGRDGSRPEERFRRQCSAIAGAIRRSVPGGPDLVALQEVENEGVLRTLRDGWLRGLGYRWYAAAGGPPSATRVGVLSRLPIARARSHLPAPGAVGGAQRAVLELELCARGTTLHLLNNHWKSRIGGTGRTEAARVQSARTVAARVRRILASDPAAEILVVGDLNEDCDGTPPAGFAALAPAGEPSGCVIALVGDAGELDGEGAALRLYEPWLEGGLSGSYAYAGAWGTPDHVLLGRGLFDDAGLRYRPRSFRVATVPFLLDAATGLPRGHGARGEREYSDHLPILVTLERGGGARAPRRAPRG